MYCPNCSERLVNNEEFCPTCGWKVEGGKGETEPGCEAESAGIKKSKTKRKAGNYHCDLMNANHNSFPMSR